MKHRVHLACFSLLIALGVGPVYGATPASVSGSVCNSAGTPQIGAIVQLLRPDLSVAAQVYTDVDGRFRFQNVKPGKYALKAMAISFLPSLRENVRIRHAASIINLTLNTLYEAIQWLPSKPRSRDAQKDDWIWTLRSAANRPLLRWLEDGPLVVVSDGSGSAPKLKARLMATGAAGTFGEDGERYTASVEDTPTGSRELLARVDFAPNSAAGMESMLGFRQDLGFAGSVQSVAAVSIHPDIGSGEGQGFNEAAVRSSETLRLGPAIEAEVGTTGVIAHLGGASTDTVTAALPYAQVGWTTGDTTIGYRMATLVPASREMDDTEAGASMPRFTARDGSLTLERGMHQEIGWERQTDDTGMSVVFYSDSIDNPAMEATSHFAAGTLGAAHLENAALVDNSSGMLRAAGPNFSSTGVVASFERRLPGGNDVRLSYANGEALVMQALPQPVSLEQTVAAARPHRAQTYTLSLSGTLEGTGTRWRASYRWQPDSTVTAVAPYAVNSVGPYMNIYVRQPIRLHGNGVTGFEALIDVSNLLAEGYRPYLLNDGSLLVFAQGQRSIRGGLAFTF
jgi:Carboxypeptidase regulatory-like domain